MIVTTVKERGLRLPVGKVVDGHLVQTFTLRPYKSWVDRAMGNWRQANQGRELPYLVAKYLSLVVAEACGRAFSLTDDRDSLPEVELGILEWPMVDVFYAYLMSRISAVTSLVAIPFTCPQCRTEHSNVTYDLSNMRVECADEIKDIRCVVPLRDGFRLADGTQATSVTLSPAPWRVMLIPGVLGGGLGTIEYQHLRETIVEVNGESRMLLESELDDMGKLDRVLIDRKAGGLVSGPSLQTVAECTGERKDGTPCRYVHSRTLVWTFDDFFESSVPEEVLMKP